MKRFFTHTGGATAIEYGLIVAGIAVVIAAGVFLAGGSLTTVFSSIEGTVSSVASSVSG